MIATLLRLPSAVSKARTLYSLPIRSFPRGIYKEQQLEKQRKQEQQFYGRIKPVDPERALRLK